MKMILVFALAGLLILAGTVSAYFLFGGPTHASDWANFGTFVGGVAGVMLSFLALVALVWTVRLQYDLLKRDHERQLADQHIRWLDALYADIRELLDQPLIIRDQGRPTSLRAVLFGESPAAAAQSESFKERLRELMRLLGQYCQAAALYRDNVSEYFDLRIFVDRGARLLDRVKPFQVLIGNLSPISIEFCDMHLRGETSRKDPEALQRSSRS